MSLQERIDVGRMFIIKSESVQEAEVINALTVRRNAVGSHVLLGTRECQS